MELWWTCCISVVRVPLLVAYVDRGCLCSLCFVLTPPLCVCVLGRVLTLPVWYIYCAYLTVPSQ